MERVGNIIIDSQADYDDGGKKQHMLENRIEAAAATTAADLSEADEN